jgi:hypothetical protein
VSQFFDFAKGKDAANPFHGPMPNTSNLKQMVLEASAALNGLLNQKRDDLLVDEGTQNPDLSGLTLAELRAMFGFDTSVAGFNLPIAGLEPPPSLHSN